MTPELEALGRRAVACKGWRWMAGMLAVPVTEDGPRTMLAGRVLVVAVDGQPLFDGGRRYYDFIPDLCDPATLGCLLALVREAWGRPDLVTRARRPGGALPEWLWWVDGDPCPTLGGHSTEAASLVAALEAAP